MTHFQSLKRKCVLVRLGVSGGCEADVCEVLPDASSSEGFDHRPR